MQPSHIKRKTNIVSIGCGLEVWSRLALAVLLLLPITAMLYAQGAEIVTRSDQTALFVNTDINNATVASLLVHGYSPVAAIHAINSNSLGTALFGASAGVGVFGQGGTTGVRGYGTQYGVRGESSGGYAGFFSATGANPTNPTNIGLFASASGGTNNIAAIFGSGNVGVGTSIPEAKLHVNGTELRCGVFNSIFSGAADVLRSEYTGITSSDGHGIVGIYQPSPWYGIGGYFAGGFYGIQGVAETADFTGSRTGIYGRAAGGNSSNYGVYGSASANSTGSSTSFGLYGAAEGPAGMSVYGVYGTSFGTGSTRYAGYFSGNLAYTGSLINASDSRFKKNIVPLDDVLSRFMRLKPSTYEFSQAGEYKDMNFESGRHFGLIAQDVESVFPELVIEAVQPGALDMQKGVSSEEIQNAKKKDESAENMPTRYKGVKYMELIPVLISAVQSQQREIEQLRVRVNELSSGK